SASPQFFTPCVLQGGVSGGPGGSLGGILCLAVSEPSPGIPQFMSTGYLDGIPFVLLRQRRGRVELLTRVDGEWSRAEHWERKTQTLRGMASVETRNLETVPTHGSGFMAVISCLAGSIRGSRSALLTMDGIISPLTQNPGKFMLADSSAETTGKHWEQEGIDAERWTNYLKHNKELGIRWNAPDVHVSGTRGHRDADPILPRGVQFYPNTIAVSWMKGGETLDQETGGRDLRHGRFPEPTSGGNLTVVVAVSVIAAILILTVLIGFSIWRLQSGNTRDGGWEGTRIHLAPFWESCATDSDPTLFPQG
uniref:Uncharacterized protein n=1 Tax=Geospiza parvula TaxID=87175 RepID=A0A8U8CF09_GEOPR